MQLCASFVVGISFYLCLIFAHMLEDFKYIGAFEAKVEKVFV
jgi:hypothetical protein